MVTESWLGKDQQPGPSAPETPEDHFANFIACVISRKKEDLRAPIEEGHFSAGLAHLANASYRLGRTLNFDPETQLVKNDEEANQLLRDGAGDIARRLWYQSRSDTGPHSCQSGPLPVTLSSRLQHWLRMGSQLRLRLRDPLPEGLTAGTEGDASASLPEYRQTGGASSGDQFGFVLPR